MDWSNERYVRIYTRDTKTWKLLGWEGQTVLCLLARRFDRSGILDDVRNAEDVALMIGSGFPIEIAAIGLTRILEREVMIVVKDGLLWPNFMEAQEASKSNAQRQREFRERRRVEAKLSRNVTDAKQNVTKSNECVTARNEEKRRVTPTRTVPTRTVPDLDSGINTLVPKVKTDVSTQEDLIPHLSSTDLTSEKESKRKTKRQRAREAKGTPTWKSYADAYAQRYGREPVRNAKTNSLCVQLVDVLGADVAPEVAAYYLSTNAQPYAGSGHTLALLVRDYQKLHTEMLTGSRVTQAEARERDRLQGQGDSWRRVIAEREQKRKNGEH